MVCTELFFCFVVVVVVVYVGHDFVYLVENELLYKMIYVNLPQ